MTKQKMKSDSLGDEKVKKVAPCFLNFSLIPVRTWQTFQDNTNNEIRVCNFFLDFVQVRTKKFGRF